MTEILKKQEEYPITICLDDPEIWTWRGEKTSLRDYNAPIMAQLTARKTMEFNHDLGIYPRDEENCNHENKWMTLITFEIGAPFNMIVLESIEGQTRVKTVDYIRVGERLLCKYEREQKPVKPNWNCVVREFKSLRVKHCEKWDCRCCSWKSDENYFSLQHEDDGLFVQKPTTKNLEWKNQLEINFHRAENMKNNIFRRISLNPLTIYLRHELWDETTDKKNVFDHLNPKSSSSDQSHPSGSLKRRNSFGNLFEKMNRHLDHQTDLPENRVISGEEDDNLFELRNSDHLREFKNEQILTNSDDDQHFLDRASPDSTWSTNEDDLKKSCLSDVDTDQDDTDISSEDSKCDLCGNLFLNEHGMRIHRTKTHLPKKKKNIGNGLAECDDCKLLFLTDHGMKIHRSKVHIIKERKYDGGNDVSDDEDDWSTSEIKSGGLKRHNSCSIDERRKVRKIIFRD